MDQRQAIPSITLAAAAARAALAAAEDPVKGIQQYRQALQEFEGT